MNINVLAYVLMSNHVHIVLQLAEPNLADLVHGVHYRYARRFNRRHGRVGHTFNNRYKSRPIVDDTYLLEATRYVHLNPVEAGLVRHPKDYIWSSYQQYLTAGGNLLIDPTLVLSLFGSDPVRGRAAYESFVLSAISSSGNQEAESPLLDSRLVLRR